jgi:hypothetical protein
LPNVDAWHDCRARGSRGLLAAADWYEDHLRSLRDEFLDATGEIVERIAAAPLSFPVDRLNQRARRALVTRFPFAIVFLVVDHDVRIICLRSCEAPA